MQLPVILLFLFGIAAFPQQPSANDKAIASLEKGCIQLESNAVTACRYDYKFEGRNVEAISFQPASSGRYPGVLMIPGYQRTAVDLTYLGVALAKDGFASLAVSQPGFG